MGLYDFMNVIATYVAIYSNDAHIIDYEKSVKYTLVIASYWCFFLTHISW